jgi:hypothetical protein
MIPILTPAGTPVKVISGKYKDRTGTFKKNCSAVFPDHVRIVLDLKPRQRTQETIMIEREHLELIKPKTLEQGRLF